MSAKYPNKCVVLCLINCSYFDNKETTEITKLCTLAGCSYAVSHFFYYDITSILLRCA